MHINWTLTLYFTFLTNPHQRTRTLLLCKLREQHHSKEGGFIKPCSSEGLSYLPPGSLIRELCCTQIELSEWLPFNPPFHAKNTQTPSGLSPSSRVTLTKWSSGWRERRRALLQGLICMLGKKMFLKVKKCLQKI